MSSDAPTIFGGDGATQEDTPPGPAGGLDLRKGDPIGRYVVLEELGRGGMGVVYSAYDPQLDRKVAVKLLHPRVARGEHGSARLLREAQALARVTHPNVITVHDVGTVEDAVFVAMEYLDGQDLEAWCEGRPWSEVLDAYLQAGRGLAAAHAAGLVHRDFKPDNVIMGPDGRARVLDFGLARAESDEGIAESERPPDLEDAPGSVTISARLTRVGAIMGTPAFMAPEQFEGGDVDHRSDQFSFCVALWEGLHGQRPYSGTVPAAILFQIKHGEIVDPAAGSPVPSWVRSILVRGLAVDPDRRWPSMDALLAALTPRRSRAVPLLLGLGGVAAVVAAVTMAGTSADPDRQCVKAGERVAEVWSPARKARVSAAFERTGVPFSAAAVDQVGQTLDEHARAWAEMRTDACRAARVRGEQSVSLMDLRMACLDRRLAELDALSSVFEDADAKVVEKALEATAALGELRTCADVEALRGGIAPPADGELASSVALVRAKLARATAELAAGRSEDARELASGALETASGLDYPPAEIEAESVLAEALVKLGEYEKATDMQERLVWRAIELRHDRLAAETAIGLTLVVGHKLARPDDGHWWGRMAAALIERLGGDRRLEANRLNSVGVVYFAARDFERAEAEHVRALELLEDAPLRARARTRNLIANAVVEQGDNERALDLYTRTHAEFVEILGPRHPMVGSALNNLGIVYERLERWDEAEKLHLQALEIKRATVGDKHPSVGGSFGNLANVAHAGGKYEDARRYYEQAREIFEARLEPNHPYVLRCINGMAEASLELGESERAAELARQVLERGAEGPALKEGALARWNLARAGVDGAEGLARQALKDLEGVDAERVKAIETWLAER